jgi:hypothetical protein
MPPKKRSAQKRNVRTSAWGATGSDGQVLAVRSAPQSTVVGGDRKSSISDQLRHCIASGLVKRGPTSRPRHNVYENKLMPVDQVQNIEKRRKFLQDKAKEPTNSRARRTSLYREHHSMNYVTNPDIQKPTGNLQARTDIRVIAPPKHIADVNSATGYAKLTNFEKRAGIDRYKTDIPDIYSPLAELNKIAREAQTKQLGTALHAAIESGKKKKAEALKGPLNDRWAKIVKRKVLAPMKLVNAFKAGLDKHHGMLRWGVLLEAHYKPEEFSLGNLTPNGALKNPAWRTFVQEVECNTFGTLNATVKHVRGFNIGRRHRYPAVGISAEDAARQEVLKAIEAQMDSGLSPQEARRQAEEQMKEEEASKGFQINKPTPLPGWFEHVVSFLDVERRIWRAVSRGFRWVTESRLDMSTS